MFETLHESRMALQLLDKLEVTSPTCAQVMVSLSNHLRMLSHTLRQAQGDHSLRQFEFIENKLSCYKKTSDPWPVN